MITREVPKNPVGMRFDPFTRSLRTGTRRAPPQAEKGRSDLIGLAGSLVYGLIMGTLILAALSAVLFALVPVVFLAVCLFLPVLLPLGFVGLTIMATRQIETPVYSKR